MEKYHIQEEKKNQVGNRENEVWKHIIHLPDLKTCCHISFDMLSSDFCSDCRYLIYLICIGLENLEKSVDEIVAPSIAIVAFSIKG